MKHTSVGLEYHGSLMHFFRQSYYDSLNQDFMLSLQHEFSAHAQFSLNESAGIVSRQFGLQPLSQSIPFDPSTTYVPVTDYFDNRTIYSTTMAALKIQKSLRLSYQLGGGYFIAARRSSALADTKGRVATGDVQYRLTRRTSFGANYAFQHFSYGGFAGGTDAHVATASYSIRLSRMLELSAFGGVARVESTFLQQTAVDPAIAQLLGVGSVEQVVHTLRKTPTYSGRLSRTFRTGVLSIAGGRSVLPGNGLFLTSFATNVLASYTYTGLRRWSLSSSFSYLKAEATGSITGTYGTDSGGMAVARSLGHGIHFTATYTARWYNSPTYTRYNRLISDAQVGFRFTPGDLPVRFW